MQQQLAKRVVYALKGYFREQTPEAPTDLSGGQTSAELVVRRCIDSRDTHEFFHHTAREAFESTMVGAMIPVWDGGMSALQTSVNLGLPAMNIGQVSAMVVKGHQECGAVAMLYKFLRTGHNLDSQAARLMLPMVDPEVVELMRQVPEEREAEALQWLEQYIALKSVQHLYGYSFEQHHGDSFEAHSVRELAERGDLLIIAAVRGMTLKPDTGRYPLMVFDPEHGGFRDIEDIYLDAGSPDFAGMEQAASWRQYAERQHELMPFVAGARAEALGTIPLEEVERGLKKAVLGAQALTR
ncbi:MAG: hypothetical protein J0L97_10970 [Alphaproteobacteria bacterium]|nr:hypothetical protein [Alphaproteobacteria bacterium]